MARLIVPGVVAAAFLAPVWGTPLAGTDDVEVVDATPYRSPGEKTPDPAAVARLIVGGTNEFREAEGRAGVAVKDKLEETAKAFAAYMARTGRYGHTADGKKPADRAADRGYEYCLVAENIAYAFHPDGFTSENLAARLVKGWKESPGHRKNMLDPDLTETGVAVARSDKTGHYFAVQLFGRPKSYALKFTVENRAMAAVAYRVVGQSYTLKPGHTRTHELCRPTDVVFELPTAGEPEKASFAVENGRAFVLTGEAKLVRVTKK